MKFRKISTAHEVVCNECGPLEGSPQVERDAFRVAYAHAAANAHEVVVTSSVTTTVSGSVEGTRQND